MTPLGYSLDLHPPVFLTFFVIIFLVYLGYIKLSGRNFDKFKIILTALFIFYLLSLFKVTFLPFYIMNEVPKVPFEIYYQLVPFKSISIAITYNNWIQIIGNLALLIPLIILISLKRGKPFKLVKLLAISFLTSLTIEIIQFIINIITRFPQSVSDVDDLILNILGALIAGIIFNVYYSNLKLKKYNFT